MDELDLKLIAELKKDARQPNVAIAARLGVSEGTIRNRVAALQKDGIIERFTVRISPKEGFSAIVLAKTDPALRTSEVVEKIKKIAGVESVYETAGEWDVIFTAETESPQRFNEVIEAVRTTKGVIETQSLTVLKIS